MERAIYRGKRKDNGEWIQGYPFCFFGKAYICWGMTNDSPDMIEVDMDTMGQFTGLLDKNHKQLFEGDIVQTEYGRLYEIAWREDDNYCGWGLKYMDIPRNKGTRAPTCKFVTQLIEVVGNVHDGLPELEIGTVYFADGHVENITRLFYCGGDISKEDVADLGSFMFTTVSGDYRFGYCLKATGDDSSILYYKNPVFEKRMPDENLWCSVKDIEKVELKTK